MKTVIKRVKSVKFLNVNFLNKLVRCNKTLTIVESVRPYLFDKND